MSSVNELSQQKELAESLAETMRELEEVSSSVVANLTEIQRLWNSNDFPGEDDIMAIGEEAGKLEGSLIESRDVFNSNDFPDLNSLQILAEEAGKLNTELAGTSE